MPSPGFEPMPYGTAVSVTNHYTGWAVINELSFIWTKPLVTRLTNAYLSKKESEKGVKCTPFHEMRVKTPYASAMDFCALGLLKRVLGKRLPRTQNGLWKTVQEDWGKICGIVLRKSLPS
ncbi:hypothetical protein TNCV_4733471 [Trichonephila clavipes]|nr:hypothetical protein TNCV_4733471 [Trichonephila clavipes]